ncbi:hypothetical protein ACJIZ3_015556 [Penstemon smallii]|uniref:Uncharacterized protein n=1 Tax=Penstemon smallii TaxID=265156 RepID=A0ABD3RN36_9LAMI
MNSAKLGSGLTTRAKHSRSDGSDIDRQLLPIELEEPNCTEEAGGENCSDTENLFALVKAAEHLSKTIKKLTTIQFFFDSRHEFSLPS